MKQSEAAPRRPPSDDTAYSSPERARRNLFDPNIDWDRGRSRVKDQRSQEEIQYRAKSLNTRQTVGPQSPGVSERQRPRSLERTLGMASPQRSGYSISPERREARYSARPDLSPPFKGQNESRGFRTGDPSPRNVNMSFYEHQPRMFWNPVNSGAQLDRKERAKTIAVPRAADLFQPYLPTLSETRRSRTTGDLTADTNYNPFDGPFPLFKSTRSSDALTGSRNPRTSSPVLLRRKPKGQTKQERPKSMPNDVLRTQADIMFALRNRPYDVEDTPVVRPPKQFDLFPGAGNQFGRGLFQLMTIVFCISLCAGEEVSVGLGGAELILSYKILSYKENPGDSSDVS